MNTPPIRSLDEPMPVSGRSQPRETPDAVFQHDVRLYGTDAGEVRVACKPCAWFRTFEPGHTPHDFVRLELQHITGRYA